MRPGAAMILAAILAVACGDAAGTSEANAPAAAGCAHVEAVEVREASDGAFAFDVTVRSADTGWDKYADAWEVVGPDGEVLGTRVLAHPHENEQPFTRSLSGVEVPAGVERVKVRARDSVEGFCGDELEVELPGRA